MFTEENYTKKYKKTEKKQYVTLD